MLRKPRRAAMRTPLLVPKHSVHRWMIGAGVGEVAGTLGVDCSCLACSRCATNAGLTLTSSAFNSAFLAPGINVLSVRPQPLVRRSSLIRIRHVYSPCSTLTY